MFYLYMKQRGEGCDYTIGCAQKLIKLRADSLDQAKVEVAQEFEDRGFPSLEGEDLGQAILIQANAELNMLPMLEDMREKKIQAEKEDQLASKRAQLEKLKRELGEA